jgi:F-type H+-transporting ATPase subunit epsilon
MASTMKLTVVSPSRTVFEGAVTGLVVPAWDGKLGVLPGHAPMIALLGGGTLAVDLPGGGSEHFFLNRGVVKVQDDEVTILSEYAAADAPPDFNPGSAWLDPADPAEMGDAGNPLV